MITEYDIVNLDIQNIFIIHLLCLERYFSFMENMCLFCSIRRIFADY